MTKLTFYGGASEIGGNKILLEDKDAKIYLDFGESFDFGEDYFFEYLQPRTANGLEVYFEFDLIPKIPKLYSKDMLKKTDLKYEVPDVDAVFISHSHSDHMNHLSFLDEAIPIYIGHGTKDILDAYKDVYAKFYDYGYHYLLNTFKSGETIKVKHLEITPIHVEHSIPGAYGFIIKTSKGNIVYTGDLRLHGPKHKMTEEFIEKAKEAKPAVLLCEGTRMTTDVEHDYTEEEVHSKVDEIVKKSKGTVFTYFSMSNVDRFNSFYKAAVDNNRILVIDTNFARIMTALKDILPYPDPLNDPNIKVYFRYAKSCTFNENDYTPKERLYCHNMITFKEIMKEPDKYLMHIGFFKLMELIYLQPSNADFIYSMSEHFLEGEENKDQRVIWENWMKHFDISFHKVHCSGHMSKQEVLDMVKTIDAEVVIPIHTQNAAEFKKEHRNVKVVGNGDSFEF